MRAKTTPNAIRPDDDDGRRVDVERERDRDRGRERREDERQAGGGAAGRLAVRRARRRQARRGRLHDAVADHPDREERADLPEAPAELGAQEDGQADDEPDVARGEQEDPRRGEDVDGAVVGEHVAELRLAVRRVPSVAAHQRQHDVTSARERRSPASSSSAVWKPIDRQQQAAEEEADALQRVLRAGEDRDPAEERVGAPSGTTSLTALLELILVRSLAMPDSACAAIT